MVDIFRMFPSVRIPFVRFIQLADRIQPRFYSVASSSKLNPNTIHLLIKLLSSLTPTGPKFGLFSNFINNIYNSGSYITIRGYFRKSVFSLPE